MSGGTIQGRIIPIPVKSNNNSSSSSSSSSCEDGSELRRGPWTLEEDNLLIQYISCHGEGRWNSLAKSSGLNRTGKSCRLRWLNYLKPDIKRGNLTPQEQLLILELHSKWGNRWSKIAQHLPGRTDNEIKNYWRTRVQKQARQLKVDSNSDKFLEAIRMYWMPRLLEKIQQNSSSSSSSSLTSSPSCSSAAAPFPNQDPFLIGTRTPLCPTPDNLVSNSNTTSSLSQLKIPAGLGALAASPLEQSFSNTRSMNQNECYHVGTNPCDDMQDDHHQFNSLGGVLLQDCQVGDIDWFGEDIGTTFWNTDELWQFRKPEGVLGV